MTNTLTYYCIIYILISAKKKKPIFHIYYRKMTGEKKIKKIELSKIRWFNFQLTRYACLTTLPLCFLKLFYFLFFISTHVHFFFFLNLYFSSFFL